MTSDCKFYVYTCKCLIYKKKQKKTWRFKIDMKNLTNFDSNTLKSQKFALKGTYFYQSI